jgi:hypothetical protein
LTVVFLSEVTEPDISHTDDVAVIAGGLMASEPAAIDVGVIEEAPR